MGKYGSQVTSARPATSADIGAIADVFTTAFFSDPVWGPAFPDEASRAEQSAVMWRVYAASALRYPWTFVTPNVEAAAIWIPPGGIELTPEEASELDETLEKVAGPQTAAVAREIDVRFAAAHPDGSFFHLTILGTHTSHRGHGLGMALVADGLARIDALGAAAYLESTNPANIERYRGVGFEPRAEIIMPAGQVVTTMWRAAR
jgi:GNAT superfamily N-acetyltransferase